MRLFGDKLALAGYLTQVVETHLLLQKAAFKRTVQTHCSNALGQGTPTEL